MIGRDDFVRIGGRLSYVLAIIFNDGDHAGIVRNPGIGGCPAHASEVTDDV